MLYTRTTATKKIQRLTKRIRGVAGGTSASKTISILLALIDTAQAHKNLIISIVSETMPHLKRGAMREFLDIMKSHRYYKDERWNRSDFIYTFETGTIIEFFSADQDDKVRGPRRDILFLNEANNIPYNVYDQLEIRTKETIWLDWNPVAEFWFYVGNEKDIQAVKDLEDTDFITLTYLDNEALDPRIKKSIESKKHLSNWWQVYGLGELGDAQGRIYSGWRIIDKIPDKARFEGGWLDYGYSNDPTASGGCWYMDGWYILDEWIYETGLLNSQIAQKIRPELPRDGFVVADSAEPKSNAELTLAGIPIVPADKGKDSIVNGIQTVQGIKIAVTKRSVNLLKEYRNYLWLVDKKTGKSLNLPQPVWNHHMDGIRYLISFLQPYIDDQLTGQVQPQQKKLPQTFADEAPISIGEAFAEAEEETPIIGTRSMIN